MALGAHYDHLGHGEAGNTLADKADANKIHFGADDNASGDAAVLATAAALSREPRARNVLVAFWSGEELGLIGSNAFAANPPLPLDLMAVQKGILMVDAPPLFNTLCIVEQLLRESGLPRIHMR